MFKILILLLLAINVFAKTFSVASYNVENLFDLKLQGTEYKEYIPNNKYKWDKKAFNAKITNITKVINEIDADIIALQEVENDDLMKLLSQKLPKYKYYSFTKYQNSSVGLGFLSKEIILENKQIDVKIKNKKYRPILETVFQINNIKFSIFNNHWPSKRASESYRIQYALALNNYLKKFQKDYDYILLGDFNSNYDEFKTIRYNEKLNDSQGLTGINDVLKTSENFKMIHQNEINEDYHFNLWLEIPLSQRFSTKFRNENNTPDNIIIPNALFDNKKISYVDDSFKVFINDELYSNNKINRWQMDSKNKHLGSGYSDHLPIIAEFSTNEFKETKLEKSSFSNIDKLYKINKIDGYLILENAAVIYKYNNNAIIKQRNNRSIYLYGCADELKNGFVYDLKISELTDFNGLKEIKNIVILDEKEQISTKDYFLNGTKINLKNTKYQNEIIGNLTGTFNNGYLSTSSQKIKLYAKDKTLLPKNNQKITILNSHLGTFRGQEQLNIYKKSDYEVIEDAN